MEGVVGQPGVVLGVQEEEFGRVGHHAPILVHPGDAGRRVGLHQHKEQQEEPGVVHLLVAGICVQDLWLIWAANTGSEAGGGHSWGREAAPLLLLGQIHGLLCSGHPPSASSCWCQQDQCLRPYTARRGARMRWRWHQRPGGSRSS